MVYLDQYSRKFQHQPLLKGKKRDAVVGKVMDILDDWRDSPFQNEGTLRFGLRSALCLGGQRWPLADVEAATLIAEGLHRNGAVRPSWNEGQRENVTVGLYCLRCYAPLDNTTGRKFCDSACAQSTFEALRIKGDWRKDRVLRLAYGVGQHAVYSARCKMKTTPRQCAHCSGEFGVVSETRATRYCSKQCQNAGLRTRLNIPCKCCGTMFLPHAKRAKFCSVACASAVGREQKFVRKCEVCCTSFVSAMPKAKYCRPACNSKAYELRKKVKAAVIIAFPTIDPAAFDREFQRAA